MMQDSHDSPRGPSRPRGEPAGGGRPAAGQKAAAPSRPSQLEVRHLRLVQAVSAEGGVTRAARRLHLSQSAASHQLIDLERALGARLFDRVGKRMVATAAGRRVALAAERVLAELWSAERELLPRPGARKVLRIAADCYTSYHWLPPVLARFTGEQSGVDMRIVLEATQRAGEALGADEVDLAIVGEPLAGAPYASKRLFYDDVVALLHPSHPLAGERSINWWALSGDVVLIHDLPRADREGYQRVFDAQRAAEGAGSGRGPREVRRLPLTEAIVELVRAGFGVGVVGRSSVVPHLLGGGFVTVPLSPGLRKPFFAAFRRANPRDLPLTAFVASARAVLKAPPRKRGA